MRYKIMVMSDIDGTWVDMRRRNKATDEIEVKIFDTYEDAEDAAAWLEEFEHEITKIVKVEEKENDMKNNTTLKFASFRVKHGVYDEQKNKIDYQFYRVEGQRATDLNWEGLSGRIEGEEVCKVYAEHLREELKNKGLVLDYCPIYNPGGYAYETRYQ